MESPFEVPDFVGEVPDRPWPARVRLHQQTALRHVALVVGQWAAYGRGDRGQTTSLASLCDEFPAVAPGGLAAVSDGIEIAPSCCCGLERWRDWELLLATGTQPWLGHDPSPWVEVSGSTFVVWSNGGLGEGVADAVAVKFSTEELQAAITSVERDLQAFRDPLRAWANSRDPMCSNRLVQVFESTFLARNQTAA